MYMKALAIDYGLKKHGIAISDDDGIVSAPLGNIPNYGELATANSIIDFIQLYKVDTVVIGFPFSLRPDQEDTPMIKAIKRLKAYLEEHTKIKVAFWDESYSSKIAEKGLRGKARKNSDSLAAKYFLQEYLDEQAIRKKLKENS